MCYNIIVIPAQAGIQYLEEWGQNQNKMETEEFQIDEPANALEVKLDVARKIISRMRDELDVLERLLEGDADLAEASQLIMSKTSDGDELYAPSSGSSVVEGVFDGEQMVGSDGRRYVVPVNYASKSKLVEGDLMKLIIQANGTFNYKQIGPIDRVRVIGALAKDEITGEWCGVANGKKYYLLSAAISYFKGEEGDEVVLLIPKSAPSKWAAVENIIKQI